MHKHLRCWLAVTGEPVWTYTQHRNRGPGGRRRGRTVHVIQYRLIANPPDLRLRRYRAAWVTPAAWAGALDLVIHTESHQPPNLDRRVFLAATLVLESAAWGPPVPYNVSFFRERIPHYGGRISELRARLSDHPSRSSRHTHH